MNNGAISNNQVKSYNSSYYYGGGVYAATGATFTMNGGAISNNQTMYHNDSYDSGIYGKGAVFTMNGGTISANNQGIISSTVYAVCMDTARWYGDDNDYHYEKGTFIMSGGVIKGAVYAHTFTMTDGAISSGYVSNHKDNNATSRDESPTFTVNGGTISGSTEYGVSIARGGVFIKKNSGGIIYGTNAADALKNTLGAVCWMGNPSNKYRYATVEKDEALSVNKSDSTTGNWNK